MSTPDPQTPRFSRYFCSFPFEHAAITATGEVYQCCAAFLPTPAGNLSDQTFDEVWNSEQAQAVRRTIHEGTFTFCREAKCPYLQGTVSLPLKESLQDPEYREIIEKKQTKLARGPREVHIAYDTTCNLACPFCRNDFIALKGEELEKSRRIHQQVFDHGLRDATRVMISAQGDPFASKLYSQILENFDEKKHPKLRIKITTNGLLFTEEAWERIRASHDAIDWIHVSVNAATAESFRINQKGGDFERLMKNLHFIKTLRRKPLWNSLRATRLVRRKTRFISLSFIIQQNNYREIPKFIELGKELDIDQAMFTSIFHADRTFSDREFAKLPVHLPNHPEHQEFLRVMADTSLADPMVYMGPNIKALRPEEIAARGNAHAWRVGDAAEWDAWYAALGADAHKGKTMPQRFDFAPPGNGTAYLPSISLDDFAQRLEMDAEQRGRALGYVNDVKAEISALFCRVPLEDGETPCRYLAGLVAAGIDGEILDGAFKEYLDAHHDPDTELTYTQAMGRIELERRGEIYRLLRPGQRPLFKKVPIDSLLVVDTGRDPFQDRVREEVAKQRDSAMAAGDNLYDAAGLQTNQAHALRRLLEEHKAALAELFNSGDDSHVAPLEVLAAALAAEDPLATQLFIKHAAAHQHPGLGMSYLAAAQQHEEHTRRQMRREVTPEQWRALMGLLPASLAEWPSGSDPMAEAVGKLIDRLKVTTR